MSAEQLQAFGRDGYVVVPDIVDESVLVELDREIDTVIANNPPPHGKVDAPGKRHRKPPKSTRGAKHSDTRIAKMKLVNEARHRPRG